MANPNKPEHMSDTADQKSSNPNQPKGVQSSSNPGSSKFPGQAGSTGSHENYSFRCADAGFDNCPWETKGGSQDEVLHKVEQHGREQHHLTNIDENMRNKVRSKIHKAA